MYVRHLLLVLLATISTTGDVMAASFNEDEDDFSETVSSLEQAFSLYPEDWKDGPNPPRAHPRLGNSEDLESFLLQLQQDKTARDSRLSVDDFTGTEDTVELDGGRTITSTSFYNNPSTESLESPEAKGKPVRSATLTAPVPPLTRVSEFFRSMMERFGGWWTPVEIYQSPGPALAAELTTERSRLRSHRFRPHFVSTAKGLRNIPAQLNDGQLVHAPDDTTDSHQAAPSLPASMMASRRPTGGESTASVGRTPATTPSSTITKLFNNFKRKIKAIYPGTVWCGDGNQAKSEDDIGFFYLTDSCCRAHDLCPITIAAGEQFNRLRNNGHFTRSHCDCDKQFYNCLKNADTLVSRQIGYTYFNLLKPQCFRYEHPKVSCTQKKKGKCLTYVVNEQQSKQWQWFDNLIF